MKNTISPSAQNLKVCENIPHDKISYAQQKSRIPSPILKVDSQRKSLIRKKYSLVEKQFIDSIRRANGLNPKQYNLEDNQTILCRDSNSYSLKRDINSKYLEGNYRTKTPRIIDFQKNNKKRRTSKRRNQSIKQENNISLPKLSNKRSNSKPTIQRYNSKLLKSMSPKDRALKFYKSKAQGRLQLQRKLFKMKQKL